MELPADGCTTSHARDGAFPSSFRVPALDGLRAVAALLVFATHAFPGWLPVIGRFASAGRSGVTVFFALSGFLVTYLLLREEAASVAHGGSARFSVFRFWARRCLRIWPLYFLAVTAAFVAIPCLPAPWHLGVPAGSDAHTRLLDEHGLPAATFVLNWSVIEFGWARTPFSHLWSVAVEEQLYICLPLFLLLCPARLRRCGLIAITVASIAWQAAQILRGDSMRTWYVGTFSVVHSFAAGALVAELGARRQGAFRSAPRWVALTVSAIYVVHAFLPWRIESQPILATARLVALDCMSVGALWCCLPGGPWSSALAWRPLAALGRVSFGLYVWHPLILEWTRIVLADVEVPGGRASHHLLTGAVALVATIVVASATYRFVERPFLMWKDRLA